MPDIEDQVRDLLERRAADVAPRVTVPPRLVRRAHGRFVAYATIAAIVAAIVLSGVLAALDSSPEAPVLRPGGTSSVSSASSSVACAADQLEAVATVEGAAGSREGTITLRNLSAAACESRTAPIVSLADASGSPLTSGIEILPVEAPNGEITLLPGQTASMSFRWSNWCAADPPIWRLSAPTGGQVVISGVGNDAPPCNGPGEPSTIEVRAFEVDARP
jgi:hypothetical protein